MSMTCGNWETIMRICCGKVLFSLLPFLFFWLTTIQAADMRPRGEHGMDRIKAAADTRSRLLGSEITSAMSDTDPEFAAIRDRLLFGEIATAGSLDDKQRELVTLASLTANQSFTPLKIHVAAALNVGATPVEIKETIYQTAPYVGFPRADSAIAIVNEVFEGRGIKMPPESQSTVSEESRFEEGLAVQKKIFGAENIEKMQKNAPAGQQALVTKYLSAFCFGDFYTRKGLDLKMRELITFSAIVSLGGCDPQAKAHAAANISVGNSKQNLVDALAAMIPFIGFPRTLNGLAAVNAAVPE